MELHASISCTTLVGVVRVDGTLLSEPDGGQSVRDLAANVNKLCVLVAVLGFCADASADIDARGNLRCTFVAPSNFWGLKSLTGTTAFSRQPLLSGEFYK